MGDRVGYYHGFRGFVGVRVRVRVRVNPIIPYPITHTYEVL